MQKNKKNKIRSKLIKYKKFTKNLIFQKKKIISFNIKNYFLVIKNKYKKNSPNLDKIKNSLVDIVYKRKFLSIDFDGLDVLKKLKLTLKQKLKKQKYLKSFNEYLSKKKLIINEKISNFIKNENFADNNSSDLTLLPPPPIWSRIFIWTLGTGSVTLIIWSIFTTIEETILLTGELTTITPEVKVSAMDPGKITEVLVKTNQYVDKNTLLIIYEDDETTARLNGAKKRFDYTQNQRIILFDSYDLKLEQLDDQIKYKQDLLDRYKILKLEGVVSEMQYLETLSELKQLKINYDSALLEKDNILYQNAEQLEQLSTLILELEAKINRFKIISPVSGFIQTIKYQSPGERIMSNDVVITIVPDNELIVKVSIPSKVSAPITSGMEAIVEVDAYPADDFGGIIAEVFTISPTVSSDNASGTNRRTYIAEIKLIAPEISEKLKISDLRSGMAISTKIKLRDKPIIASIFNIVSDIFDPLAQQK